MNLASIWRFSSRQEFIGFITFSRIASAFVGSARCAFCDSAFMRSFMASTPVLNPVM